MKNQAEISTISHTFKKEERLCSKKLIDQLFQEGKSFLSFPLKVVYLETAAPLHSPAQAGFTVSKKNFKRAVHRNRIKRLMRETYRLQKHELYQHLGDKRLTVFFIFIAKEITDYKTVEKAMKKALQRIIDAVPDPNLQK